MAEAQTSQHWRDELKATLLTHRELGEEMEDEVIESFLGRLQRSIDEQVEARVKAAGGLRRRPYSISTGRAAVVLCLSIPLIAIAGDIAGTVGILAVVALIMVLLLLP